MCDAEITGIAAANIIEGSATTSARIRALAHAGYKRADIARLLDIRYQHVRKVLVDEERRREGEPSRERAGRKSRAARAVEARLKPSPDLLMAAGFQRLGEWTPLSNTAFHLSERAPSEPGIYAFVVDGIVRYIGLTQTGLHIRMGHYRRGHKGHKTSSRVKALILDCLAEGKPVTVLVATPDPLEWNGLPVNVAAGLEAALIRAMRPEWNMLGAAKAVLTDEADADPAALDREE